MMGTCAAPHPEFGYGMTCALYWHHGQPHHSMTGPDEHWYGTALILHPTERSPYGVITQGIIHEYERMTQSFVNGWMDYADSIGRTRERPPYWLLRDFVLGIADIPLDIAAQIAMHHCNPYVGKEAYCPDNRGPFHALV